MPSNARLLASLALLASAVSATVVRKEVIKAMTHDAQPKGGLLVPNEWEGKQITASNFAATAWHTQWENKTNYNLGLRVFYVSTEPGKCEGIQELSAYGGAIKDKNAQGFIQTYCFKQADYNFVPDSAFAATSLTQKDKGLVDLRLFYWSTDPDGTKVIKAVRWSPSASDSNNDGTIDEPYKDSWTNPYFDLSYRVPFGDTNHLSALSWMDGSNNRHWSVFYIERGTLLKELTIGNYRRLDGFDETNWHNGGGACGKPLQVELSEKVKKIGRVQATMWVGTDKNIYKRVYVLDADSGKIHEYGSVSGHVDGKTTAEPLAWIGEVNYSNINSFAVNTDGKGSGLRLYVNTNQLISEVWMDSGAETFRNNYDLSKVGITSYERASDAVSGTKVASAFQRYEQKTYQFVFYSGADNKLMMSQRDMDNWIHGASVKVPVKAA
ncbi:hypothetical protein FRC02_011860 [Tulasnella sp. 418]|nr:hypothetical protein FRC02_011860 [Tulasnella sp. 418]